MNSGFIDVEVKVVVAGPNGRNFRAAWDKQKERSEATLAESCVYLGHHSVFLQDPSYTSAKSPKMGVPLEYTQSFRFVCICMILYNGYA